MRGVMIEPHGGRLVDRVVSEKHAKQIREKITTNPVINLDWSHYQDLVNIATGRFSPLEGFLARNDFMKVVHDMTLENGTVWPLPVTLDVDTETADILTPGERAGLRDPNGSIVGAIEIDELYRINKTDAAAKLYGTDDHDHPGVRAFEAKDSFYVGGPVFLFGEHRYNQHDLLPAESRVLFQHRDWETVAGFQTRNAPHRAHEYIQRSALEHVDGLLVQPKVGKKKVDDYRDETIIGAYNKLVENYYRSDRFALSVFPSKMRYAGPREAVYDALVRKNQGCSHFVVGRDHAGVGDYYGEFDAQRIFESIEDIDIEVLRYDYAFFCRKCDGMTTETVCPHGAEKQIHPSGTEIRRKIRNGKRPSSKVMRPEVADYIMQTEQPFVDESMTTEASK